jgi:hypothetical protein
MADKKHLYIEHAARHLVPTSMDHVLEFGVFKGKSLRIIKNELDKKPKKYDIFGFDSFKGLPEDWLMSDGDVLLQKGTFSTDGKPPNIPGVVWFTGWFKETIPEYLKIAKNIALLHIDCDLYRPTIEVLYGLQDFIVKGTVIAMDDWFYERDPIYNDTVQKAFYEWAKEFNRDFRFCEFPGCKDPTCGQKIVEVLR